MLVEGLLFLVGLSVGSFLNCLVYRLNEESLRDLIFGRSVCPQCSHRLAWYDNIPLFSFLFLRGRCRYCQKRISLHYPLVELITACLFVLTYQHFQSGGFIVLLFYCFIVASLIAVSLSDFLYQTVPDEIVYSAIGLTILFQPFHRVLGSGFGAAAFFLILVLITKGRGMGLGDVKLAGLIGLVLSYPKVVVALYLAFLTGAFVGVILISLGKKRFGEQIPFGPFLSLATIISLLWGEIIWKQGVALLLLNF